MEGIILLIIILIIIVAMAGVNITRRFSLAIERANILFGFFKPKQ